MLNFMALYWVEGFSQGWKKDTSQFTTLGTNGPAFINILTSMF
jgi:hypothetical protein